MALDYKVVNNLLTHINNLLTKINNILTPINNLLTPLSAAGMIIEPIQAEGGDNHASGYFFRKVNGFIYNNG